MVLHHSDLVSSHHERPGCSSGFPYYVGVALMEPIVQLSNAISSQVLLSTCVDIPELHCYAKS